MCIRDRINNHFPAVLQRARYNRFTVAHAHTHSLARTRTRWVLPFPKRLWPRDPRPRSRRLFAWIRRERRRHRPVTRPPPPLPSSRNVKDRRQRTWKLWESFRNSTRDRVEPSFAWTNLSLLLSFRVRLITQPSLPFLLFLSAARCIFLLAWGHYSTTTTTTTTTRENNSFVFSDGDACSQSNEVNIRVHDVYLCMCCMVRSIFASNWFPFLFSLSTTILKTGLAEHKDTLGSPLCPCRHYDDKEAEVKAGFWNCPCIPMRERKECHCMLFLTDDNDFAGDENKITIEEINEALDDM